MTMGSFILNNVPDSFIKEVFERFQMFQLNETVLPPWRIRFHSFIPKEKNLQLFFVGSVNNYFFYKTQESFFIFKRIEKRKMAVKSPRDFSELDVYCEKYSDDNLLKSALFELMREAYRYYALKKKGILLHSSSVLYKNEAIAFFGYSGAGKSTQAQFWNIILDAKVINYDQNYLFKDKENGQFLISSTPWGGKEKYYINYTAPLKAVIMVQKALGAFENKVVRLGTAEAFSLLYTHNYVFPLDKEVEDNFYYVLEEIVTSLPIYIMYCSYGEESVKMLYDEIYKN